MTCQMFSVDYGISCTFVIFSTIKQLNIHVAIIMSNCEGICSLDRNYFLLANPSLIIANLVLISFWLCPSSIYSKLSK